ncbi:MAG: hypothetical protein VW230_05335 [Candidatus Poseidoniales archaeon]
MIEMFELPPGSPVQEEIHIEEGKTQTFDFGVITTWIGKRKTPSGHRLVRAGRIVGYLAEDVDTKQLVGGKKAKELLEHIESENKSRHTADEYSQKGLGQVADLFPEAFEHQSDRQGLLPQVSGTGHLLSKNASAILSALESMPSVRGAVVADNGVLIDSTGQLPKDAEQLAISLKNMLDNQHKSVSSDMLTPAYTSLRGEHDAMMVVENGSMLLGVWTEATADHSAILSRTNASLEGDVTGMSFSKEVPDGFVVREGKGGTDAIISMLTTAVEEQVTGHIKAGVTAKSISLLISRGLPVGFFAQEGGTFSDVLSEFTDAKKVMKLHRLPSGTLLSDNSGNIDQFSLDAFLTELPTVRTTSEARQETLAMKLKNLFGFEQSLAKLRNGRKEIEIEGPMIPSPTKSQVIGEEKLAAVDLGLQRRLEQSESKVSDLMHQKAQLEASLATSKKQKEAAEIRARQLEESKLSHQTTSESAHDALNSMQLRLSSAQAAQEEAEKLADKLMSRVNELEHQVSTRAAELAKALGEASSAAALQSEIEAMALKEADLQSEVTSNSERLQLIRQQIDDEERRLRVLNEQVSNVRERHVNAQAETMVLEEKIQAQKSELDGLHSESKHARDRTLDEHRRLAEDESRRNNIEAELRELMNERRNVLRELGDIGARRGHAEAELASLVEQAKELAQAHEEALEDIKEAERLRARLSEEPLAQVLLDDNTTFKGLGPILERLEHSRTLGYSVVLLDRAVERALQVIQSTVDNVAATPRHLLSSEVMTMLERQVPDTAGAVRGLARWSVQQRLEVQLGETVTHLILDLEHLLEDYDRSITMLRRIRNVLEQLARLGAPQRDVDALLANCQRPESLPMLAQGTRKLIQVALDDIYLEADQRDAGESIMLEETAQVLEELITQLDASGLTDGVPRGMLWEFQRDGFLPYERTSIPQKQRIPVQESSLEGMESSLVQSEQVQHQDDEDDEYDEDGWANLEAPTNDEENEVVEVVSSTAQRLDSDFYDERAALEEELARMDSNWKHYSTAHSPDEKQRRESKALDDLESKLADVEF